MARRGAQAPCQTLERLSFDPELQAVAARVLPTPEREEQLARERELENQERRRWELIRLRRVAREAADGVYGARVRAAAREILAEGHSEAHLQRVRKAVWRLTRRRTG